MHLVFFFFLTNLSTRWQLCLGLLFYSQKETEQTQQTTGDATIVDTGRGWNLCTHTRLYFERIFISHAFSTCTREGAWRKKKKNMVYFGLNTSDAPKFLEDWNHWHSDRDVIIHSTDDEILFTILISQYDFLTVFFVWFFCHIFVLMFN